MGGQDGEGVVDLPRDLSSAPETLKSVRKDSEIGSGGASSVSSERQENSKRPKLTTIGSRSATRNHTHTNKSVGVDVASWLSRLVPLGLPRSYARFKRHASFGDIEGLMPSSPDVKEYRLSPRDSGWSPRLSPLTPRAAIGGPLSPIMSSPDETKEPSKPEEKGEDPASGQSAVQPMAVESSTGVGGGEGLEDRKWGQGRIRRGTSLPDLPDMRNMEDVEVDGSTEELVVNFPGGGKFFYWQSGVATFLNQHFDLKDVKLTGASAGSLTATLMACEVDGRYAAEVAVRILRQYGVYERPMGLIGVWGYVVRDWLHEILPDDAHVRCSGRVHISVLRLPYHREHVSSFNSKSDLIEACMASTHLPMVMDGKPVFMWRGRPCVDGSIMSSRTELPRTLSKSESMTFDYLDDEEMMSGSMDFMKVSDPSTLFKMIEMGYKYAERLHKAEKLPASIQRLKRSASTSAVPDDTRQANRPMARGMTMAMSPVHSPNVLSAGAGGGGRPENM